MTSNSPSSTSRVFQDLITPVKSSTFFDDHFGKSPLVLHRQQAEFYNDIISLNDLDAFFSHRRNPAELHVMDESAGIHPDKWTAPSTGPGLQVDIVDTDKLWTQIRMGRSVRIHSANKTIPCLQDYCAQISRDLEFPVHANIYITPPSATALNVHYDTHDVLVLQISGSKNWQFYDSPVERPGAAQNFDINAYQGVAVSHAFTLVPGDLAYIPRGLVHQAESTDTTSVHVSLGLHYKLSHELISALAVKLQSEPKFRQALPHGYSSANTRKKFTAEFTHLLNEAVQGVDVHDLLSDVDRLCMTSNVEMPAHRFSQILAAPKLSGEAALQKRPNVDCTVTREKTVIRLALGDSTIELPKLFEPLLDIILGDSSFTLSDWNILASEQTKQKLAIRMIEAGLLEFTRDSDGTS